MKAKSTTLDEVQSTMQAARQATERHEQPLPADPEEAWKVWSAGIQKVDERGMTLLRAAFRAGVEVGRRSPLAH